MADPLRFARYMVAGARQPITRSPADVGLAFEDVAFPATDGVRLDGWFIPAGSSAPLVVWVHGWPWNRHGNSAGDAPWRDGDIDLLPATAALHAAGFAVLMFDLANHGTSGRRLPLTYGVWEARDVAGAVAYARTRDDVDASRVGLLGTSAGGSTALYAAAEIGDIQAVLAVQPTRVTQFGEAIARDAFGAVGPLMFRSLAPLYWLMRAPQPTRHDPAIPATTLTATTVAYVQGTGDQWGSMAEVERMSTASPRSLGVVAYPSEERYGGYRYIDTNVDDVVGFFAEHL